MSSDQKKIALVLGSGAARGLSHIGVLKILEEHKIPIHMVVGTSMGAMVGGAYAAGLSASQIEEIACGTNWLQVAKILFPKKLQSKALLDGERVQEFLLALFGERKIEDLQIPFASIATDIWAGEEIILDSGSLITAIRASISVPFLFTPMELNGRHLVDGGVVNPLPINIARDMGADIVIAVGATPSTDRHAQHLSTGKPLTRTKILAAANSSAFLKRFLQYFDEDGALKKALNRKKVAPVKSPGMRRQMVQMGVTMENMILALRLKEHPPDVLITPQVDKFQFFDFAKSRGIIDAGTEAAILKIDELIQYGSNE